MTRPDIMPGWLDTALSGKPVKSNAFCSTERRAGAQTIRDMPLNSLVCVDITVVYANYIKSSLAVASDVNAVAVPSLSGVFSVARESNSLRPNSLLMY